MHTLQSYLGGAALACLAVVSRPALPPVPPETRLHRMGERVTVGSLVYNVFEDQWKAQLGEGTDYAGAEGPFFPGPPAAW